MALSFGTGVLVDASAIQPLSIVQLSSTLHIVIYSKSGSLKARTVSIATPPTVNAEVNIDTVSARAVLVGLSATTAMVVYYDGANAEARILSVSGTTITVQSPTTLTHSAFTAPALATIDSTNALYTYSTVGSSKAVVLSVSGTTITENTIIQFEAATTQANKNVVFSSTKAINTWYDGSNSVGIIIDISGTTLTANTKKTIRTYGGKTGDYSTFCARMSSTIAIWGGTDTNAFNTSKLNAVELSGTTFNVGADATTSNHRGGDGFSAASQTATQFISVLRQVAGSAYEGRTYTLSGLTISSVSSTTYAPTGASDFVWCAPVDSSRIIAHFFGTSTSVILLTDPPGSHLWLSTDGGATYTDIGDTATWLTDLVGGVVVVPGTAYQTIFAAVGTSLYKTTNGGTNWSLETAVGYEVNFIDLEKDNTTVFLAKRDAAGTNRASLWDSVGASLSHINTGKSTTGGATSGGDVV